MTKEERILRSLYPEREYFTIKEIESVRAGMHRGIPTYDSSVRLPWKFVPVGCTVEVGDECFVCVEAEKVSLPMDACIGCAFSRGGRGCKHLQCSPFDRRDHKFVWFKEVLDD